MKTLTGLSVSLQLAEVNTKELVKLFWLKDNDSKKSSR